MNRDPVQIIGFIVVLIIAFIFTDCTTGTNGQGPGSVVDHKYVPAWVQMVTTCDKNSCRTTPVYHPEQHILVAAVEDDYVDVQVKKKMYYDLQNGARVLVKYRKGSMTKYWYNRKIELLSGEW